MLGSNLKNPITVKSLLRKFDQNIRDLYPGYPALVMATGIISNAFYFMGWFKISQLLFVVNLAAFPILLGAILIRLLRHTTALWTDLLNPRMVFSFFTIVAASDVLGIQLDLRGYANLSITLWIFALITWAFLLYFSFAILSFFNTAHDANVVHGGWLIAIVGTQSLVLLGVRIADHLNGYSAGIVVLAYMLWGVGLGLYAIFVTLFSYRISFFKLSPDDLSPLLWVVMGAAAISVNSGTSLILANTQIPFLAAMKPFIDGVTMMIWAWGTWWIPLLVTFGVWKHGICRVPISYNPMLWSLVFPLGMYSVATFRFSLATQFPFLQSVGRGFVWIAAAVWLATLSAMVLSIYRSLRAPLEMAE